MTSVPVESFRGTTIRGYHLEELVGQGTLTAVYRGRSQDIWQPSEMLVVLFTLPETISEEAIAHFRERFFRVAQHLTQLHHPNIFPLYGYGEYFMQRTYPYFLLQNTVGELLKERMQHGRSWDPIEVLPIIDALASALDYLHSQGIVYQFLNPAHVLFPPNADSSQLQLTGVALPHILSARGIDVPLTQTCYQHLLHIGSTYQGDPEYIAPEVIRGEKDDMRSDVYSLGILLFELLASRSPFKGKEYLDTLSQHLQAPLPSLTEIRPDLPLAIEIVVNRALHYKPEQRYQTARALIMAYKQAIEQRVKENANHRIAAVIEKIRNLPASPLLTLRPVPAQMQEAVWPHMLLRELRTEPALPLSGSPPETPRIDKSDRNGKNGRDGKSDKNDTQPLDVVSRFANATAPPREQYPSSQQTSPDLMHSTALIPSSAPIHQDYSYSNDWHSVPVDTSLNTPGTPPSSFSQDEIAPHISSSHPDMAQLAYQLRIIREQLQNQSQDLNDILDIKQT